MAVIFLLERPVRATRYFASATVAADAAKPLSDVLHAMAKIYRGWVLRNAERRFERSAPNDGDNDDGAPYADMRGM
jgi:hypothetical protein